MIALAYMFFQLTDEGCSACDRVVSLARLSLGNAAPEERRRLPLPIPGVVQEMAGLPASSCFFLSWKGSFDRGKAASSETPESDKAKG